MSVQNATEFLVKVAEDQDLAAQLENINTAEELIRFAQAQGYEFSAADMQQVKTAMESDELSEDQLEAIAGGWGLSSITNIFDKGKDLYDKGKEAYETGKTIYSGAKTIYGTLSSIFR